MAQIKCVVVTPEETALEQDASFVVVPLYDGEFGIGVGHSPMIGRLGYGELRVRGESGAVDRYYVDGGFVQVADNTVSLLTGKMIPAGDLDASTIEEQLTEANKKPANTDELREIRDKAILQARSQIRIARRTS